MTNEKDTDRPVGEDALWEALKPFAALDFSFDGFSLDPAEMVVLGRSCGQFWPKEHAYLADAIKAARAALTTPTQPAAGQGAGDAFDVMWDDFMAVNEPLPRGNKAMFRAGWDAANRALTPSTSKAAETLAEAIKLKMDEPHFREWRERQAEDITKLGYLLAFRVRPTGTNSLFVRLSSGRDIIVGEHEWTPAPSTSKAAPLSDQGDGWRTMDSAPKDGSRIQLLLANAVAIGKWLDNSRTQWSWTGWTTDLGPFSPHQVRGWQPLAAPPTPADDTAREGK